MKRTFVDLHLRVNPNDTAVAQKVIGKAAELGYRLIAIPFSLETRATEAEKLREICLNAKIDFASRIDLYPRTKDQLTHLLRKFRRRFELVAVVCENKEVARQAAKDRRVDLLSFQSLDYRSRFFDWAEAELASSSLAALEIDVKPLLVLEGPSRVRLLSCLRREVSIANEFHVPVVISSGASSRQLLRKPREMAAFASLFGLSEVVALDAVSTNPSAIVRRNREKLSRGFVAPGIRVVKEGGDC
jgi:ribonuclease P/MRP protein subunit RPP1